MIIAQTRGQPVESGARVGVAAGGFDAVLSRCEQFRQIELAIEHRPFEVRILLGESGAGLTEIAQPGLRINLRSRCQIQRCTGNRGSKCGTFLQIQEILRTMTLPNIDALE